MENIFISWGSPDRDHVYPIIERLQQHGLNVLEYENDMPPGANIQDAILETISSSTMALIFFSEKTAGRPWLSTEIDWVFSERKKRKDQNEKPLQIVPVKIGDVPDQNIHHLLKSDGIRISHLPMAGFEGKLTDLVERLCDNLGTDKPQVILGAMLAMNDTQAQKVLDNAAGQKLSPICQMMGLSGFSSSLLKDRYGPTSQSFSPFPGEPLLKQIHRSLGQANDYRARKNRRPIWIQWCTAELMSETYAIRSKARDLWKSHPSLLIVDSISLLEPSFRDFVRNTAPANPGSSALLWIPPYTRHTADLTTLIETTLTELSAALDPGDPAVLDPLLDQFRTWGAQNEPYIAFDIGTTATLKRWLYSAFGELVVELQPDQRATQAIRDAFGTNMRPRGFYQLRKDGV